MLHRVPVYVMSLLIRESSKERRYDSMDIFAGNRGVEGKKHKLLFRMARCFWYASGIRIVFVYLNTKRHSFRFYKNIVCLRRYIRTKSPGSRSFVDSLPSLKESFANLLDSSQAVSIDFDRIRTLEGISVKFYEAGALRIGELSNKEQIGITLEKAAWEKQEATADNAGGETTVGHAAVCFALPRVATSSFALHLFDIFLAFIHLEYFRKREVKIETVLFDSNRDRLSALYFNCLPACRLSQELEGVHRFQGIFFLPNIGDESRWRTTLYTCGKAAAFHRFLLSSFGIALPASVKRVKTITLVCRRKYITDSDKPSGDRIVENECELVEVLTENYPRINIRKVFLEELSLPEQFSLLAQSDVLVGMHGAGLISGAYCLPPNAGLVELFPKYYRDATAARTCRSITEERNLHYASWINHNRRNESGEDTRLVFYKRYSRNPLHNHSITRVPPGALLAKIDRLIRKIERVSTPATAA